MSSNFVYLKEKYTSDDLEIKKHEIGILVDQKDEKSIVKFVSINKEAELDSDLIEIFNLYETGDAYERKVCNICNRLLPVDNFPKNQNGKNNRTVRRPSCSDCRKIIDGKKVSSKVKKEWNKQKPNLIIWTCPVCKKTTIPGLTSKVVLDHNHNTGEPRAWICDSCNTGLGRFKDDVSTMKNAIEYLEK